MNLEERQELERRAARHAALSDPVRLRVVDLLGLGDLTPTELQRRVGVSSNLLAHHLNVLESEGMVARSRSEADRRRSYVRLLPTAFDGLIPGGGAGARARARRVVFVCAANSARSQLAAALWEQQSRIPVTSAGTHPADRVEPGAIAVADRNNLPLRINKPRPLSDVLAEDDFVVTVCDTAREELGDLGGVHWSVADPVRTATDAAFDAAFDELAQRVGDLAPRLAAA